MRVTLSVLLFFALSRPLIAAAESMFQDANQLYQNGKYSEAASIYEDLLQKKEVPEVYYNLGNAYFKDQKLGSAILSYERALKLSPRDRDVRANLTYANRLIEYKIEDKRNWSVKLVSCALGYISLKECWLVALVSYMIFISVSVIFLLIQRRLVFGKLGVATLSFAIVCALVTFLKQTNFGEGQPAIVTEETVEVRYGPAASDRLAFRMVEGLKVFVTDTKPGWYRLELRDRQTGWVPQSGVTLV